MLAWNPVATVQLAELLHFVSHRVRVSISFFCYSDIITLIIKERSLNL